MEDLIRDWPGECVVVGYDRPSDTWMFIAIHDTTLGPAMGGCRMMVYESPRDALRDAMRLAEGMTYKWAGIGFPQGGGKSVLAVSGPLEGPKRRALFHRFGKMLNRLKGAYATGEDLGTTPEDMAILGEVTPYVHGVGVNGQRVLDPGPYTALGVFVGIRAAVRHALEGSELSGRAVLIQGAGDVGVPLARLLAEAGARVLVSDLEADRARTLAEEVGGETVDPEDVYDAPCDVYAPCAVGGTLNADTVPRLACRIVAGSANNQLAEIADADRLHARGILYAPDYIINAGGATALPMFSEGKRDGQVRGRVQRIEQVLDEIFTEAAERNESPHHAAARRVERTLEGGKE